MAGNASRENGKKGGRPKGYVALQAELKRQQLVELLDKEWKPIVIKAIQSAKDGDATARAWLAERGYGRVSQSVDLTVIEPPDPIM